MIFMQCIIMIIESREYATQQGSFFSTLQFKVFVG